ncbi:MAG: LamG domain-containing protein, partial [Alphaproteobacteria bacterium]|nr:LamG domain-containing protein [Alphaproteobacteria bacterium]
MRIRKLFIFVMTLCAGLVLSGVAQAACALPVAEAGAREWFAADDIYKFCDGTNWIDMRDAGGLTACTATAAMEFEPALDSYKVCDGAQWRKTGCGPIVTGGLVAHWQMNENTGGTTADRTSGGHTGTISGATWQSPGYAGAALNFDGADDFVNAGSAAALDNIGPHSVSVWIYPRTHGENNEGWIISKASGAALPTNGWRLAVTNDFTRALTFAVHHNTTHLEYVTVANAVTFNTWNHVIVTWNGTTGASSVAIHVNGVAQAFSYVDAGAGARVTDAAENLYIGNNPAGTRTFDGYIDEARVYGRVLTGPEIAELAADVPVLCCAVAAPTTCVAGPTEITAAGQTTYVIPAGCDRVKIEAFGGGGGGASTTGGGGGGGGTVVRRTGGGTVLAVGGGGGGGAKASGGGGGGYGMARSTVTPAETLDVYVGGGGARSNSSTGGAGGLFAGGAGGGNIQNGGSSTYGGGGGAGGGGGYNGGGSTYGG